MCLVEGRDYGVWGEGEVSELGGAGRCQDWGKGEGVGLLNELRLELVFHICAYCVRLSTQI